MGITYLAQFRWGIQACEAVNTFPFIWLIWYPFARLAQKQKFGKELKEERFLWYSIKEEKEITYSVIDIVSVLLSGLVIEFSKTISYKSNFRDGLLEIGDICGRR